MTSTGSEDPTASSCSCRPQRTWYAEPTYQQAIPLTPTLLCVLLQVRVEYPESRARSAQLEALARGRMMRRYRLAAAAARARQHGQGQGPVPSRAIWTMPLAGAAGTAAQPAA